MRVTYDHKQNPRFNGLMYLTAKVQENTLLNRGLVDLGGIGIPQTIMANNKDEAIERGSMSGIYFIANFISPLVLLPFFNKRALIKNKILNNLQGNEKRIIEVSKEFLTKDGEYLEKGIKKFADELFANEKIDVREDFNNLLKRFPDKEVLRKKLLKTHENVLTRDFITTDMMWVAVPWIVTEATEHRTHKKGFSASFDIADKKFDEKKYMADKRKKLIASILLATVVPLGISKLIMKGIGSDLKPIINSKNLLKKGYGKFLNSIKKHADNFNYTDGKFMSKTIFAAMWIFSDYPNTVIQARDKNERKDRAIRFGTMVAMFFGGDFLINNVLGRLSDKVLKTKIMNFGKDGEKTGFLKGFTKSPHRFNDIRKMTNLAPDVLKKTKNVGMALYWVSLFANMALIGFGLPKVLNAMLRKDLAKEGTAKTPQTNDTPFTALDKKAFAKLGF